MQMIEKNILLDNHAQMIKARSRFSTQYLHRLLLSGLVLFTLSACSPAIQPWVAPENSQELKQLKIDNYLLKQELGLYRKKLMQANLESRRMAEKLQQQGRQTSGMSSSMVASQAQRNAPSVQPVRNAPVKVNRPAPQPVTRKAPVIAKAAPKPQAAKPPQAKPQQTKSAPIETAKKPVPKPVVSPAKAAAAPEVRPVIKAPVQASTLAKPVAKTSTERKVASAPATTTETPQAAKPVAPVAKTATTPDKSPTLSNWSIAMTLYFDSGQRFTSPEMRKELRKFANALPPTAKLRVAGHTDSRTILQSSDAVADNKAMSKERAWSVVRGLQAYGVSPKRMQVGAFGASRPIAENDTFEGRAKNRRVEILISE